MPRRGSMPSAITWMARGEEPSAGRRRRPNASQYSSAAASRAASGSRGSIRSIAVALVRVRFRRLERLVDQRGRPLELAAVDLAALAGPLRLRLRELPDQAPEALGGRPQLHQLAAPAADVEQHRAVLVALRVRPLHLAPLGAVGVDLGRPGPVAVLADQRELADQR